MTRRRRTILAASLATIAFAVPSLLVARQGTVTTTDGRTFAGDVSETPDAVVIDRSGIQVKLPRGQVKGVDYSTFEEKFDQRLAGLDKSAPKDVAGRVALAREAFNEKQYDLALRALDNARAIDPNDAAVADLTTAVRSQRRLQQAGGGDAASDNDPTNPPPARNGDSPVANREDSGDWLTDAQVNRVRQAELTPADRTVRVRFDGGVDRKYVEAKNIPFRDFRKMSQAEQALAVLEGADDETKDKVTIATDPKSMLEYRRVVQPAVLAGCATSACHAVAAGGKFALFNDTAERPTYSNFYILATYQQKVGDAADKGSVFGGPALRSMIDRAQPDQSLLLNYALPPNVATYPHPKAAGYNGIFKDAADPKYRAVAEWMGKTLRPIRPEYGVDYTPPGTAPSTQPAAPAK